VVKQEQSEARRQVSAEAWCQIDQICLEFEREFRTAGTARIEDYLSRLPESLRALAFDELLGIELQLHAQRDSTIDVDDYRRRFPNYAEIVSAAVGDTQEHSLESVARPISVPATIPTCIGKYKIISQFHAGGQARVYRAVHPTLETELIIKLGHPVSSQDRRSYDGLIDEGKILAALDHPNIARVYDLDFHEDRPYLVMEFVRGRNLRQHFERQRAHPRQAASVLAKIARALHVAHQQGIVHRDIKPENIVMDSSGQPRIIDFGLAQQRHAWRDEQPELGCISGTLGYMAPEQARGETDRVDARTDVFALGGMLYWLLTGQVPYRGDSREEILHRAQRSELDIQALEAVIPKLG
jgi:serine/threonine protein kinase